MNAIAHAPSEVRDVQPGVQRRRVSACSCERILAGRCAAGQRCRAPSRPASRAKEARKGSAAAGHQAPGFSRSPLCSASPADEGRPSGLPRAARGQAGLPLVAHSGERQVWEGKERKAWGRNGATRPRDPVPGEGPLRARTRIGPCRMPRQSVFSSVYSWLCSTAVLTRAPYRRAWLRLREMRPGRAVRR